jgi:TRAP-type uncharacterized transport system substrate-binding protein
MNKDHKAGFPRVLTICSEYFGLNRTWSLVAVCFIAVVTGFAIFWFVHSAPPRVVTISSGPAGSIFESNALKYRATLASKGVTLKILRSEGSQENLKRLEDPAARVDVGFVQGGVAGTNTHGLVSLGSISYEPLLVFHRGTVPIKFLSQLEGKRLAIGSEGSGTRSLALALLQTNGIAPGGSTTLEALDADAAAGALLAGTVDAVFLMSDSASAQTMRTLLRSPGIQLMSFEQADAYTRRFNFLNKLRLPEGSIDLGKNLPAQDVSLIGPTVELVARPDLNAAVSDLLLDAAQEAHGKAGLFQNQSEFPAPLVHEFKISADALRYYKSGKSFLYRELPFWIASLVNRVLVAFIPIVLVLIPGLRLIPAAYKWRSQLRIYRWYRKLLALERELTREVAPGQQEEQLARLNEIENVVKHMKVPASFADQFYDLRGHIDYVRGKLTAARPTPPKNDR